MSKRLPVLSLTLALTTLTGCSGGTFAAEPVQPRSLAAFQDSLGVNTHLRYAKTAYGRLYTTVIKPRLLELGIKRIRDGIKPGDTTDAILADKFKELAAAGIKTTLIIDSRKRGYTPETVAQAYAYLGDAIDHFEGPNEWDLDPEVTYEGASYPDALRDFQNNLYAAIKDNPALRRFPVLAPSIVGLSKARQVGPVNCDFGNVHVYLAGGYPENPKLESEVIPKAQATCPGKPIIASEAGFHTATAGPQLGLNLVTHAKYMPRVYLEHFRIGFQRTFLYEFIDQQADPADKERNFGLLQWDGTPKPAFTAIKNMTTILQDCDSCDQDPLQPLDYTLNGDTQTIHQVLLQTRDGRYFLILWQATQSFERSQQLQRLIPNRAVMLTLKTPMLRVLAYEPVQASTPIQRWSAPPRKLSLQVPDHPLILELVPERTQSDASLPAPSLPDWLPQWLRAILP